MEVTYSSIPEIVIKTNNTNNYQFTLLIACLVVAGTVIYYKNK